jgi:CubicO group peptidase (beta-lactamase class C family)
MMTILYWRSRFLLSLLAWAAAAHVVFGQERTNAPFTAESLRAAASYLKGLNGHAMLVYHRDQLVFEEYFNDWSADQPHRLASGTKSFSGAMLATAVEHGLLTLDEKVVDTITEWKDDPRKSQITIRHLLSLTSGIVPGSTRERSPSYARSVAIAGAKFWPGQRFQYGPIPYQIFGELMRRKLAHKNESVEAYMKRRILDPIGLTVSRWVKDEDGNVHLPNGMSMTAREWAKFGKLILQQGKWDGRQVVPWDVLKECFVGSRANPNYGITFWLKGGGPAPDDMVAAHGLGSQILYIIPSLELVVVQFAETEQFDQASFLRRLLVGS